MPLHSISLMLVVASLALTGCSTPQQKRDRHLETGKRMLEKKDYSRALLEFKSAIQATPGDAESYYQFGRANQAAGDLRTAAIFYQKATKMDPKHVGAQLSYAELLAHTPNRDTLSDAESRLKGVLSATPDDPRALNSMALTEFKLGRTDEAKKELAVALEKSPSYFQTYANIVRLQLAAKDVAGAETTLLKATRAVPESLAAWMLLERFYVASGRLPEAEAQLHKALGIDPRSPEALMELGRIQLATRHPDEADKTFKRVSDLPYPSARSIHARFLLSQGKTAAGMAELEELFRKNPKDRGLRKVLIETYLAANRDADAERSITEVLQQDPKDLDSLLERVELYIREGKVGKNQSGIDNDITAALHYQPDDPNPHYLKAKLDRIRGEDLSARQELREVLRLDPARLPARLELADSLLSSTGAALEVLDAAPAFQKNSEALLIERNWVLIAAKRYPEARANVAKALQGKSRTHDLLVQDGILKMEANDVYGARASLEAAIESGPEDLRALRALVQTYPPRQAGAAIAKIKQYAVKRPDSAPLQGFLGEMLLDSGDNAAAREFLAKAQKLSPGNDLVDLEIARLDIRERRIDQARQTLNRLIASGKQVEQAALLLGSLAETAGNYPEAVKQYRVAAGAGGKNWVTFNNLAYCLNVAGQHDEALKYAQQAKELAPTNPDVMDTLGWAYFNKGLYDSALAQLSPLAGDPHAINRYHLAMACFKMGEVDRGKRVLQSALKIDSSIPEARIAQQMAQDAGSQPSR
jgi:tetratricopeptide (TPR) repeat protein